MHREPAPLSDLGALMKNMRPRRVPGTYVFATVPAGRTIDPGAVVASIREPEGLSVVVEELAAGRHGLTPVFRCAWITLGVNSDLEAVGLTAAFATALARAGIGCNVVAGTHHDHIFVPLPRAQAALDALVALQGG